MPEGCHLSAKGEGFPVPSPLVSVIIPCYRQARFLPQALESVFAQAYPAIQPVVVNDGSDDDTQAVALHYQDRLSYVEKPNGGVNSARNAGIRVAEGKYLLCLDADDLLHPDAVAALVERMRDRDNRLCVMGWRFFSADPLVDGTPERFPPEQLSLLPALIYENLAPIHSYLCSKSMVVSAGGFEEGLHQCEDWELWLRLALRGAEGATVPLAGAYYRRHPGSNSASHARMLTSRAEVLHRAYRQMATTPHLLSRWGQDLVIAAHRVRRALIATGVSHAHYSLVAGCIRELSRQGIHMKRSWKKAVVDTIFGEQAEQLMLTFFRLFRPRLFARYRNLGRY
jgi:glycosyltransferase involved in cell wall biosynthesis